MPGQVRVVQQDEGPPAVQGLPDLDAGGLEGKVAFVEGIEEELEDILVIPLASRQVDDTIRQRTGIRVMGQMPQQCRLAHAWRPVEYDRRGGPGRSARGPDLRSPVQEIGHVGWARGNRHRALPGEHLSPRRGHFHHATVDRVHLEHVVPDGNSVAHPRVHGRLPILRRGR